MKRYAVIMALCLCIALCGCATEKRAVMGETPKKTIYLTFDDVPFSHTTEILDILDDYGVKGTFFMLGDYMQLRPEETLEVVQRGHAVGLHGLTHKREMVYCDEYSPLYEMNDAQRILYEMTGIESKIIRLPWGSYNLSTKQKERLFEAGYVIWDWNVDTGDALGAEVPVDMVVRAAIEGIERYQRPVVLMHNMKATSEALPKILKYIQENGYATDVLTVSENFELK